MTSPADLLESLALGGDADVVEVPLLVQGRLVRPPTIDRASLAAASREAAPWFELDGAQVLRQPGGQLLVMPTIDPRALVHSDPVALSRSLYGLRFSAVLEYVEAVRAELRSRREAVVGAGAATRAGARQDSRLHQLLFELLPELLDPEGLARAVDRELAGPEGPGRVYLDGWVEVADAPTRGITARISDRIFGAPPDRPGQDESVEGPGLGLDPDPGQAANSGQGPAAVAPSVRAVPTRQLHITAGNSPVIPVLSLLRAWSTKGAVVIKAPAAAVTVTAVLGAAMVAAAPDHPITRHTSLVYWRGGDARVEGPLFAPGAFDRVLVWGAPGTVDSVAARARHVKGVFLNPRYGLSLIGRAAFDGALAEVAKCAVIDTLVGNQAACSASLVHYVEGDEARALAYCEALRRALAVWDRAMPSRRSRSELGRVRMLRRAQLVDGVWFENAVDGELASVVVYAPAPFDLASHPMSRFVVVRRVDALEDALRFMSRAVSTVGVYPEQARVALRDRLSAAGVTDITPLGEAERAYPGSPHDGMRVLSELVQWVSA